MMVNDDTGPFTWETLNAYVDGELETDIAAAVASAVASDAGLARRVATISRLKASVSTLPSDETALPLPRVLPGRPHLRALYAGAVLLLMDAGLFGWLARQPAQSEWLAGALAAQRQWIATADQTLADPDQIVIAAKLADRPLDLSAAELRLVYAVPTPISAGRGKFLGYRGPHGCLLGFWMGALSGQLTEQPVAMDQREIEVRVWRHGPDSYALLSKGMDTARLDRLAQVVARLTDPNKSIDDTVHIALREASHVGAACRA